MYVPNSQKLDSYRAEFRKGWDNIFRKTTESVIQNYNKPIIICGDLNVARTENDIVDPKRKKNCVAGFLDDERFGIEMHLDILNLLDIYREKNPDLRSSTYWSNFLKKPRSNMNGWRIDYFLASKQIIDKINSIEIMSNIIGSDHCPLSLHLQ